MAYKTILVHCSDLRRVARIAQSAAEVAKPSQAHLIGLSVAPSVMIVPTGMPGVPDTMVIDEHRLAYRKDEPALKAAFESAARGHGGVSEWREADAAGSTVADVVLQHARAADLLVAAQSDARWPQTASLDVADRLAVESGRPVLIVPNEGLHRDFGGRVLLAWNGKREAARAAFDALPLLQRAKEVRVICINPQSPSETALDLPGVDICSALARHGVACQATQAVRPHADIGHTLLALAAEYGSSLLVMGCYGHSRLREFVLGGASRHVLAHMRIPVLTSH